MKVMCIYCPIDQEFVYSRHRHDFRSCKCGKYAIDGGRDYTKITGSPKFVSIDIKQSQAELEKDYLTGKSKYGKIKKSQVGFKLEG